MNSNKILVKLYVPMVELDYDIELPLDIQIYYIINAFIKAVNELSGGFYQPENTPILYNRFTAKPYNINLTIRESTIRNGEELVLI